MKDKDRWKSDYYSKCNELDEANAKIGAYERSESFVRRILAEQNCNEVNRLTEIIRWHINPATSVIKERAGVPPNPF